MTEVVWARYIDIFNTTIKKSGRRALLFVDNCSAHKYSSNLSNTVIKKFPVNTTSKLQPCDQGVIRSMKARYRARLAEFMLTADKTKEVDLYKGLMMLRAAWAEVTQEVVLNAWKKSGIFPEDRIVESDHIKVPQEPEITELEIEEYQTQISPPEETDIDLLIDDHLMSEDSDSDEETVGVKEEFEENIVSVKTSAECLEFLRHITNKFISVDKVPPIEIANLEHIIRQLPQVQPPITNFLPKLS